jgi:hypothetical protein
VMKILVLSVLALTVVTADAKQTKLKQGEGVFRAMARMGCEPYYLSETLKLSRLVGKDLTKLRVGTPITVPAKCPKIMIGQRTSSSRSNNTEASRLSRELVSNLETAHNSVQRLKAELASIKSAPAQDELSIVQVREVMSRKAVYTGIAIGAGAMILLFLLWHFVLLPLWAILSWKERVVHHRGKRYPFTLDTIQYACKACKDEGLPREQHLIKAKNLRGHCETAHRVP